MHQLLSFPVQTNTPLNIYFDVESDGMYLIDSYDEDSTKLSHSDFISGDWLFSIDTKGASRIQIIGERAHQVDARCSPAQRFTSEQWKAFRDKCVQASRHLNCEIGLYSWPERITPSARSFLYGSSDKATKDSGTHDIKAMRAYHRFRGEALQLMNMMDPRHSIPDVIFFAVEEHKELLNFHLLRLKNHNYPNNHPWMMQIEAKFEEIANALSPSQREFLGISFHKRTGKLNKTFNKPRLVTLWGMTHNLDGTVLRDNAGRPVGGRFLKTLMSTSPYRTRHCGVHRANVMRDFRGHFIKQRIGKLDKADIYKEENHASFVKARNDFNRQWMGLLKAFRQFEAA